MKKIVHFILFIIIVIVIFIFLQTIDLLQHALAHIIELKNLMVKNDVSNYNLYLDFWNIINDAMRSVEQDFIGDDKLYVGIYDKLFFGLNLLIRPEDEKYIPVWSQEEILKLKEIMNMGIDFFDCQFQERIL